MPEIISSSPCRLDFKSYRDWNGGRPSHTLIFYNNGCAWWVKVAVNGPLPESITKLGYLQRRSTFRKFVEAIDFARLQLLDNTVSSIALTLTEEIQSSIPIRDQFQLSENFFIAVAHQMRCDIAEDPERVIYPTVDQVQDLRTFDASCLQMTEFVAPTVSTVVFEQQTFAYKTIDHPIYEPGDTQHILDEIDALAQFHGESNIAQPVGLVVSENPYKTCPSNEMPPVIRGFLLEYYPGGSLEQITGEGVGPSDSLRMRWAIQVGRALESLHKEGRTHLDIKPSNIVLDARGNAFLIDISGTGGFTWEWLAPEMTMFIEQNSPKAPADAPFRARVATDCWAYGQLLSIIAEGSGPGGAGEKLRVIAGDLTKAKPEARITLRDTLAMLEEMSTFKYFS
jgi:serine/threonine protein kinase